MAAKPGLFEVLKKRGFIQDLSSEELFELASRPLGVYLGFDPTADSLHLGNLVGIIALSWFQRYGHTPYALIGGATGRIGDPSGKSLERPFLQEDLIEANTAGIKAFLEEILLRNGDKNGPKPVCLNNNDWLKDVFLIDFLRDIGKHFRVSGMLAKESVKLRMETEEGISFTEFCYQLLQGYDFYHLFSEKQIVLQAGGSDQWGNITAGIELIRRKKGASAYGFTFPLLTRSDGKKFGKSEKGAIWLSSAKLSHYEFYQYLYGVADADVVFLLKMLTFVPLETIEEIEKQMGSSAYIVGSAQKLLASEVTRFVRGEAGLESALKVTEKARPGEEAVLKAAELEQIFSQMPHLELTYNEVVGQKLVDLLQKTRLTSSKSEGIRLIKNEGAYLNNQKVLSEDYLLQDKDLIEGRFIVLSKGKKNKLIIRLKKPA
ncbi:MAG: tyrosine--tRNA ligase [Parachlamydiales bacterium]